MSKKLTQPEGVTIIGWPDESSEKWIVCFRKGRGYTPLGRISDIFKILNSHEALVEACKVALSNFKDIKESKIDSVDLSDICFYQIKKLEQALKLAEGGESK